MANTLNVGNGDWATKENSLLGYNSENGNYKPLPFDFTRASNGTFVNKSGLIEAAASGVPRIDFLGNTSGALLLEPQRTNLIPYSDRFNSPPFWSQVALTVSNNATISPDGTLNASKITRTSTSGNARLVHSSVAVSSGAKATLSAFFKYDGTDEIILFSPITLQGKRFSLQNATAGADFVSAPDGYGIENYGNGWYRFYIVVTAPSTSVDLTIYVQNNATTSIYLFGAQIEQGSYSTSLINTQGSAVTRVKDLCVNTVPENIVNEDEMTLYCEFEYLGGGDTIPISVHNGGGSVIWLALNNNYTIYGTNFYSGVFYGSSTSTTVLLPNTKYKVAYRTKSGDSVLYIDGILEASSNNAISNPNTLNKVELGSFWNGTNQNPNLKIIDAKCYNSGLSNSELQALTS